MKSDSKTRPIYVHYYDNGEFTIYNLTKAQFEHLKEETVYGLDIADRFVVGDGREYGYVSYEMDALSKIMGFEVGSE